MSAVAVTAAALRLEAERVEDAHTLSGGNAQARQLLDAPRTQGDGRTGQPARVDIQSVGGGRAARQLTDECHAPVLRAPHALVIRPALETV